MSRVKSQRIKQAITIADVAKAAGVSVPTVSRILNNKEYVAEDTRNRVNQAIKELGFVPHMQARQLRGASSRTLALHYPAESPHLLTSVVEIPYIAGAAAAAGEHDYFLNFLISQLTPDTLLNMYRGNQIDGMILLHVRTDDWRVDLLRENNYPFVMIGRSADVEGLDFIDLDFENAMIAAFDHLIETGHREIGLLNYPESWYATKVGPAVRSLEGYDRALQKHNLRAHYRPVELLSVEDGFTATQALLAESPQITAIITTNHMTAAGSIKALTQHGYRVPEDCSVMAIGFGGIGTGITPSLTALEWSPYEVSYQATLMMTNRLSDENMAAQQILVPPTLMVRESTKALTLTQ
jgi:DNA-binding LacI/PurR family transcriptional regulator